MPVIFKLNHYAIQSKEFFKKVKMTRGAADTIKHNHVRDLNYFKRYDFKDRQDVQLKELVEKHEKLI